MRRSTKTERHEALTRREFVQETARASAGLAVGASALLHGRLEARPADAVENTRSYNPNMEYRQLGKTGLWVSAVGMGGHWKRVDQIIGKSTKINDPDFLQNRHDVVSRCIEVGINILDFAGGKEPDVYATALKGRRDKMFLAWEESNRDPEQRTADKLVKRLEEHLKVTGLEYADVWRIMCLERGGRHTRSDEEEMVKALETARERGLCRFTGFSTHDRRWAKKMIETYPDSIQVILFPYMAKSKALPEDSFFDAVNKYNVGVLGIKPFSSNSLFKGDSSPNSPHAEEDSERARMAIRYVLNNPAISAPIPGLASVAHVDNVARAVKERRELDLNETVAFERAADEMWERLPENYQWLKDWEYV